MEAHPSTQDDSSSTASRFQNTPVDVLSMVFSNMTAKERVAIFRTCKQWKEIVVGTRSFWKNLSISKRETIESAIQILSTFSINSGRSLESVIIKCNVPEEKLDLVFDILKQSKRTLSLLHLSQNPSLNLKSRIFARSQLPVIAILSTTSQEHRSTEDWAKLLPDQDKAGFKGTLLADLHVDDLKGVTAEDLDWMKNVKELLIEGAVESLASLDEVLVCMQNSSRVLFLRFMILPDEFLPDEVDRSLTEIEIEFTNLQIVEFPLDSPHLLSPKWKFPALFSVDADPPTILGHMQVLKGATDLDLCLALRYICCSSDGSEGTDGSDTAVLLTDEVSNSLLFLPSLKRLKIILPKPNFSIIDLLSQINSNENHSEAIPSPLLEMIRLDEDVYLDREDVMEIIKFIQVRYSVLRDAKRGKPKTKLEKKRESNGEEPYQFEFVFANKKQRDQFEVIKKEIELETEEAEGDDSVA